MLFKDKFDDNEITNSDNTLRFEGEGLLQLLIYKGLLTDEEKQKEIDKNIILR